MDKNEDSKYELDEHGAHPLWNRAVKLSEQLDRAIRSGQVPWADVRTIADELATVADRALAEGPVQGL